MAKVEKVKGEKAPKKAVPKAPPSDKPAATQAEKKAKPLPRTEKTEEELVDLTSRVYKLVVERGKDGVLQSEIWKELASRAGTARGLR